MAFGNGQSGLWPRLSDRWRHCSRIQFTPPDTVALFVTIGAAVVRFGPMMATPGSCSRGETSPRVAVTV